ncbi:MAG TPA: hypothetical protein VIU61_20295 [Kofleriaceae bacterium]
MRALAVGLGLLVLACGGGRQQLKIGAPPEKRTQGVLAGATCSGSTCTCRSGEADGGVGFPDGDRKRFEILLESAQDLWVTLGDGTVLYKSPEKAQQCFYVDLSPGDRPVEVRASNPTGVSIAFEIHELGTKTRSWYDTFAFKCGHPGVCSFDDLDAIRDQMNQVTKNLHDKCGSVKVKNVLWDHGKSPDQVHPSELLVRLTLDVYKFPPRFPHGDPNCGEGDGMRRDQVPPSDEATVEPPATP